MTMSDYELQVRWAKDHVGKLILQMCGKNPLTPEEMSQAVGDLNKAWDALTDALVRQREEREKCIRHLLNQLAERKE